MSGPASHYRYRPAGGPRRGLALLAVLPFIVFLGFLIWVAFELAESW